MTPNPKRGRRVYRRNEARVGVPFFALGTAVLCGVLAQLHLVFVVGVVAFVWIAYRWFRIGVFADDEGVTIRDVLRIRKRVPWQEIDRFGLVRKRGYDVGVMYLSDGTVVAPTALQGPWGQGQAVPRAVAGLNEELAHHRAAPPKTNVSATSPEETVDQLSLPTN